MKPRADILIVKHKFSACSQNACSERNAYCARISTVSINLLHV